MNGWLTVNWVALENCDPFILEFPCTFSAWHHKAWENINYTALGVVVLRLYGLLLFTHNPGGSLTAPELSGCSWELRLHHPNVGQHAPAKLNLRRYELMKVIHESRPEREAQTNVCFFFSESGLHNHEQKINKFAVYFVSQTSLMTSRFGDCISYMTDRVSVDKPRS